jgi:hypothetical protein
MLPLRLPILATLIAPMLPMLAAQTVVFSDDFNGSLPAQVSPGTAQLVGVQGYAGLGPTGNQFGGAFLRSATGNPVTITLTGLPPHNAIEVAFLFAAIDSLDGTGAFPSGDFFAIEIDNNLFFRESFANALPSQVQSYPAPPGVTLARMVDLGFTGPGGNYTDSAYWLGGDPQFQTIGHTADTLTIRLQVEGPGIQPLNDESWAIDNLTIRTLTVGNPGSITAYGASCGPVLSALGNPILGGTLSTFLANLPPNCAAAARARLPGRHRVPRPPRRRGQRRHADARAAAGRNRLGTDPERAGGGRPRVLPAVVGTGADREPARPADQQRPARADRSVTDAGRRRGPHARPMSSMSSKPR